MSIIPEESQKHEEVIGGTQVRISSYRLGETFFASIDNIDPGATIARGKGTTREEAEKNALQDAQALL